MGRRTCMFLEGVLKYHSLGVFSPFGGDYTFKSNSLTELLFFCLKFDFFHLRSLVFEFVIIWPS